ncbi:hypothetical protein, partial [Stomatohabitans albus]
ADDSVIEIPRIMAYLPFPLAMIPAGPRRWAPVDVWAGIHENTFHEVRVTYSAAGDRSITVVAAPHGVDINDLVMRVATPLLFAQFRKQHGTLPTGAVMAALSGEPIWPSKHGEWTLGRCGVSDRPLRVGAYVKDGIHLLIANGVSCEEFETLLSSVTFLTGPGPDADILGERHRKALADRWLQAPRRPYRPGVDPM